MKLSLFFTNKRIFCIYWNYKYSHKSEKKDGILSFKEHQNSTPTLLFLYSHLFNYNFSLVLHTVIVNSVGEIIGLDE